MPERELEDEETQLELFDSIPNHQEIFKEGSSTEPLSDGKSNLKLNDEGPYWQMGYYGVVGLLFATLFVIQIPFIDKYFGGPDVLSFIYLAYGLSSNIVRVLLIWQGNVSTASFGEQLSWLVVYGGVLTGLVFFAFPVAMVILGPDRATAGFWTCMVLSVLMGTFNSFLRNVGFGLMSMAPEKSAIFFLVGQSMTGVVMWPLIIGLRYLVKLGVAGYDADFIVATITLSLAGIVTIGIAPLYFLKTRFSPGFVHILKTLPPKSHPGTLMAVFRKIFVPCFCGWICYVMSYSLFPSQINNWAPHLGEESPYDASVYHSFLIYMYLVSETLGRAVPKWVPALKAVGDKTFFVATMVRGLVFLALFLLSTKDVIFFLSYDWMRLILLVTLGVSTGINYTLSNLLAPRRVEVIDKMQVGTILSFVGTNGSFVGALIAMGLKNV